MPPSPNGADHRASCFVSPRRCSTIYSSARAIHVHAGDGAGGQPADSYICTHMVFHHHWQVGLALGFGPVSQKSGHYLTMPCLPLASFSSRPGQYCPCQNHERSLGFGANPVFTVHLDPVPGRVAGDLKLVGLSPRLHLSGNGRRLVSPFVEPFASRAHN